jgi:flagellar motor switch protein FliG
MPFVGRDTSPVSLLTTLSSIPELMSSADHRIRQVAIVLQSMDATTARGLLAQLPADMGRAVRQTMTKLGSITSAEREAAMLDMQGLLMALESQRAPLERETSPAAALLAGVQGDVDRVEISSQPVQDPFESASTASETPWLAWAPSALAQLLADERPTVIATVLNQLSPERAKGLLDHLPMSTAAATLAALPNLFLVDASILSDILAEIDRKLPKTPPSPTSATIAGVSKLSAILSQFGEPQRQSWLNTIAVQSPEVAMQLGWHPIAPATSTPIALPSGTTDTTVVPDGVKVQTSTTRAPESASESNTVSLPSDDIFDDAVLLPIHAFRKEDSQSNNRSSESQRSIPGQRHNPGVSTSEVGPMVAFDDLASLSDGDLVTLLHGCERTVVLSAVVGASTLMRRRVEALVPKADLKRFRQHLKSLGQTPQMDVDAAQNAILQKASQWMVAGKIASLQNVSFLAAA